MQQPIFNDAIQPAAFDRVWMVKNIMSTV